LILVQVKLNDNSNVKFNREKQLKSLDTDESEKAYYHKTKIALSSQTLNHWKVNYNCIIALHNFSI